MIDMLMLFAAGNGGYENGEDPVGGGMTMLLIMMAVMFVVMYFFMIRPQRKRRKEEEAMRTNVQVGDEILTIGGIYGRIVSKKEDKTYIIETGADRNRIKIADFAIQKVLTIRDQ